MKFYLIILFLMLLACSDEHLPSPKEGTSQWHLYLNQALVAWVQINPTPYGFTYRSQARLGYDSPVIETQYLINRFTRAQEEAQENTQNYQAIWAQGNKKISSIRKIQVFKVQSCQPSQSPIQNSRHTKPHWHIRIQALHSTPLHTQVHHLAKAKPIGLTQEIHINATDHHAPQAPLLASLWPWQISRIVKQHCAAFHLNDTKFTSKHLTQVRDRHAIPSIYIPLLDPSVEQWGIDSLKINCPPAVGWSTQKTQSLTFTYQQNQGSLYLNPSQLKEDLLPWKIKLQGWQQSQEAQNIHWNLSFHKWLGWSQSHKSKNLVQQLSTIKLNQSLPWDHVAWVSWEINAPIPPLTNRRQKVEVLKKDSFQVLSTIQSDHTTINNQESATHNQMTDQTLQHALKHSVAYPLYSQEIIAIIKQMTSVPLDLKLKNATDRQKKSMKVKAILLWMSSHMSSEIQTSAVDVLNVARTLRGDCNEWSALFVTLCRAWGVPAQQVFGLVYRKDEMGYHAWARVALDDHWHEVDPLWNQWNVDAGHIAWSAGDRGQQNKITTLLNRIQIKIQASALRSSK